MTDQRPTIIDVEARPVDRGPSSPTKGLPLAPPQMFTRGFMILLMVVVSLSYLLVQDIGATMDLDVAPWPALIALGVAALATLVRRLLLPPQQRTIEFGEQRLILPRGPNSRRTIEMAYADIRTVVPLSSRGRPVLVIDGPTRSVVLSIDDFERPELMRLFWSLLVERINAGPDAIEQRQRMQRLADLSQETSSAEPRLTKYLLGGLGLIFAAQFFLAPDVDVLHYLYFGANSQTMVFDQGQWWRVITANLLHGNLLHFGVNAFALYFLGTYCERFFGVARTALLIFGTAIAGALASLFGSASLFAVGISTALFGLLGAYLALHLAYYDELPPPYRQSKLWWSVILGLNVVISVAVPIVDGWGHFGGFVAGLLLTGLFIKGHKHFRPRRPTSSITNLSAAALIALFAGCAVYATGYALGDHPDDEMALAQSLIDRTEDYQASTLIQVTHQWARHSPRPEGLDPLLVEISDHAHPRVDDLFLEWRAAATLVYLAEAMAQPFDRGVMEKGIYRFEESAHRHDSDSARRALGGLLHEFVSDVGPVIAPDHPFRELRRDNDRLELIDDGPPQSSYRLYATSTADEDQDSSKRWLLYHCITPDASLTRPIDDPPSAELGFRLALSVEVDGCDGPSANAWIPVVLPD